MIDAVFYSSDYDDKALGLYDLIIGLNAFFLVAAKNILTLFAQISNPKTSIYYGRRNLRKFNIAQPNCKQ
jgi:hypothetical protein